MAPRPFASALALTVAATALAGGCSWSRFDDVTADAPIVMLKKPGAMRAGFGVGLATAANEEESVLLVGGSVGLSNASSYFLGSGEDPTVDATVTEYCRGDGACFLGSPFVGMPRALLDDEPEGHPLCFVLGIGSTPVHGNGLAVRCGDGLLFSYPVPERYRRDVDFAIETDQPEIVALATDGTELPALIVGAPSVELAFVYPPGTVKPIELTLPGKAPESFGTEVAAWTAGDARLYAVAAPAVGELYLFREEGGAVDFIGCLGGTPGFGRALATGVVLGDDSTPELAVSDEGLVYVFDGQKLAELPRATSVTCSLAALPEEALVSSFTCGSLDDLEGCDSSRFGETIAIGDLDGDGDGEVVVGAPGMTVRGEAKAGAVLVWDLEERGDIELTEAKFISSAEENDQLGASLVLPRVGERNIIAAGAPGNGKVALFYCSSLLPAGAEGTRCK
jgi:hypothetical protein